MTDFSPQFDTKPHALARYTGPKDIKTVVELVHFVLRENWRGQLVVNCTGNGGMSDIFFSEVKRTIPFIEEKS